MNQVYGAGPLKPITELVPRSNSSYSLSAIYNGMEITVANAVTNEVITIEEGEEILRQARIFEQRRLEINSKYRSRVVAVAAGHIYVGNTIDDIENQIQQLYYAEVREWIPVAEE